MKTLLFDLDGTLIDSQEGITKSVRYALQSIGIQERDDAKLLRFIGPLLLYSFRKEYGVDERMAEQLAAKYRERYNVKGAYECKLYPNVKEVLQRLHQEGYLIGLASSKPEIFCRKILEYHGLNSYFEYITGSDIEGKRKDKADVIRVAMERFGANLANTVLIGDTRFDVQGAKKVGIKCYGVTYGFGTREELEENGAEVILDSLTELEVYLEGK